MYQTLTRSSALIGRCALISRPDSTVGGKLTNHNYHFQLLPGYFPGTRAPRFGGNPCLNWLQLFHAFSSFLPRCFHPASFKTSLHIISDAKTTFSHTHYCIYGSMQTGARWPSGLERWLVQATGLSWPGSNPTAENFASELWQFRLPRFASVFRRRH